MTNNYTMLCPEKLPRLSFSVFVKGNQNNYKYWDKQLYQAVQATARVVEAASLVGHLPSSSVFIHRQLPGWIRISVELLSTADLP